MIIRAGKILQKLKNYFPLLRWNTTKKPFEMLIATVLSQNTNDRNSGRAFRNLSVKFPINPKDLASIDVREIEKAIRVAGLYRNKSKKIKQISQIIYEKFNGSLDFIYSIPLKEARRILRELPGIGPKTADVLLLFCANRPILPIDTHVNRVSKRLGLVPLKADYMETQKTLQTLYKPEEYLSVHLLLISLGRKFCKARKPLCEQCLVSTLCKKVL